MKDLQKKNRIDQEYKPIKDFFETNTDLKEIANPNHFINTEEHPEIVNNQNYKIYKSLLATAHLNIAVINCPWIVAEDDQHHYIYKKYRDIANQAHAEAYPK